jgi:EmrB/QacA subfamily drug resistance transporter
MKPPCDRAVIESRTSSALCKPSAAPWVLAATILGSSLAFIDSTVTNVALPALQASFHASVVGVQWVVESYGLFLAALILVGGALGDFWGRRIMFLAGVALFAVASAGCGFSRDIEQLIIARSIQGIGAAFLIPNSLAIISACFDDKSRGKAIGTWSGFTAITMAVGPVLGGWLIEHASWHWIFFINLPIAAAVILISLIQIPETRLPTRTGHIDWMGATVATVGLAGVVNGFIDSANLGWRHPLVVGSLVIGFACLVAFVFVEKRAESPMVPLALFHSRAFSGANLLTLCLYSAIGVFFFLFPMDFIQVQGYSATATGAAVLPAILLVFLLSRWSGGLVAHYGPRPPLMVGPLIVAVGFGLFAVPGIGGSYWTHFFPAFAVLGLGLAVSVAPLTTVVMSSVGQERAGTASGINNAVARVAGVLAIAVFGIVLVSTFSFHLRSALTGSGLPPKVIHQIEANVSKLAGLKAPAGLSDGATYMVQGEVSHAFLFGFRIVMVICAGLAVGGSLIAWRMIPASGSS